MHIEKDPIFKSLRNDVFKKMEEIVGPVEISRQKQQDVTFISPEDAIKELIELKKKSTSSVG